MKVAEKKIKRLYRSKNDRIVSGICGGIGEYLNVDPTIVRIVWLIILFVTAVIPGLIVYLIGHFIIPER